MGLFEKLKKKKDTENAYIKIDVKPLLDWNENEGCNYDPDIIPYLNAPVGSAFIRVSENQFELDDGDKPIFMMKQNRDDMEEL